MDKSRDDSKCANSTMNPSKLVACAVFLILLIFIGVAICHLIGIEPPHEAATLPWMVK